uniref:Uncharacterized protein n=1 Tax=Pithovirus LCPAC202 TaxID=2506592 RepID=A0A481Z7E5_9VIRU|nr:MAG: uncharacterized protein LCPAC202_00330 [Pithovirus LCPAC202]
MFHQQNKTANHEPARINLSEIGHAIDRLSLHQNITVIDAMKDDKLKESYEMIQTVAAKFYGTQHYQQLIVEPIMKKTVISLNPGTIGQFLFGGMRPEYGMTTLECSPIGIGAIPPNGDKNGESSPPVCQQQVWYYQNKEYRRLTDDVTRAKIADIYVPISFNGLSDEDIKKLSDSGVLQVNIYTLIKDEKTKEEISIKRTKTILLQETKSNKLGKHLIKENEHIISRHQFNLFQSKLQDVLADKEKLTEIVNMFRGLGSKNGSRYPGDHQWVWVMLIFFFIIIVAWLGYNIKK